jgi:hypothetical protein
MELHFHGVGQLACLPQRVEYREKSVCRLRNPGGREKQAGS